MKKVVLFILIFILFIPIVNGKSIDDLYKELEVLENQKNLYTYLSDDDIKELLNNSIDIEEIIDTLNSEINNINNIILEKEEKINKIKEEIDNFMVFNQVSKGENIYLEYIFNAESYADMIYRYMVAEQLTNYNNNLIETINKEIEELNSRKEELNKKITKLNNEREKYKELEIILKSVNTFSIDSITSTLEEDIENIKEEIKLYQSIGCTRYMDISICLNIRNSKGLNYPLTKGCVSKDYKITSHKGIDLACNKEGTNVYSAGSGVVSFITYESNCGGNIVYIYHLINGKSYTTIYGHLLKVLVDVGDIVDENTIIGLLGGESTALINGGYDKCTNGAHLHYVVTEGFHINDFSIYTINPRYMNNFPEVLNGYFYR